LFGKEAGWKTILYLPFLLGLGVGVSINNATAVMEAIWSAIRRKPSEFVRTPKYGVTGQNRTAWRRDSVFTLKRLTLPIIEIAFGCYMASCIWISVWYQWAMASLPFLLIFAGGYFYVGFSSIYALYKMNQDAEAEVVEAVEPAT